MTRITRSVSARAPPSQAGGASPSLSNLPLELKTLILDKIAEDHTPKYLRDGRTAPVRAMSMVSREFAALAEPYLWDHFNFERVDPVDLLHVLASVLPNHVHQVKRLRIVPFDDRRNVPLPSNSEDSSSDAAPHCASDDPPVVSALYGLLVRAIQDTPKLSAVALSADFFLESDDQGAGEAGRSTSMLDPLVADALVALGMRLSSLKLFGDDWVWAIRRQKCCGGRLATFLSTFPSLKHLAIKVPVHVIGGDSLISTLAAFRHLRTLQLSGTCVLDAEYAGAPWACPLEKLSIEDYSVFSNSLFTFLAKFSATLNSFTLCSSYFVPEPPTLTPLPPLPQLHTLDITSHDRHEVLSNFPPCPLKYLIVSHTPVHNYTWVSDFVRSHVDTLKRVTVCVEYLSSKATSSRRPSRLLRELCNASGIGCQVGVRQNHADYGWENSSSGWSEVVEY